MTVVFGRNRFVDCGALLAIEGTPVLEVLTDPLRVRLNAPPDLPSGRAVTVEDGRASPEAHVRLVSSPSSAAIFWDDELLVMATRLEDDLVHVKVDLRPIGMNVYDDVAGLHIGGNVMASNKFERFATGINLAR
jgi:hypothetical protein